MSQDRKQATRQRWLELLQSHRADFDAAGSEQFWSPARDCASRDELRALQNEKLVAWWLSPEHLKKFPPCPQPLY